MKEIWAYWKNIAGNPKAVKAVLKSKRMDEYRSAVACAFAPDEKLK
jgi:hypothetical protein